MNTDPVAKLAKFTPAGAVDPGELLFAAGRASARTHWGWKAAVAGLLVSNLFLAGVVAFRTREVPPAPHPMPPATTAPRPEAPQPQLQPPISTTDEPWSYRNFPTNLEQPPKAEPVGDLPRREPLTVLSGRDGELD